MTRQTTALFLMVWFALLSSCDEKPVELLDVVVPPGDKTVLVEDFTGVSCPNCPEGARIVESLRTIYGKDRIIPIAVHTLGFDNLHPDSKYEFKTTEGQQMQDHLGTLFSKPAAAINRSLSVEDGGLFYTIKEKWPDGIIAELNRPSELNITMDVNYSSVDREVVIDVQYIPVVDINTPLHITAIIAESGLTDPQSDIQGVVDNYVHEHVLRDIITAPEGDAIGSSFVRGEFYSSSFRYTIPPEDGWWVAENCEIIVFINEFTTESKRVLQSISKQVVN